MSIHSFIEPATGRLRSFPTDRPAARRRPNGRTAAAAYVTAWLAGLAIAPPGPGLHATDIQIHAHYLEHRTGALTQSLLVHGIAGAALGALALAATTGRRSRRARQAGLAAAGISLLQAGLGIALAASAPAADPGRTAALFHAINVADMAKLTLIACFVVAASRDLSGRLRHPRAMTRTAVVEAALLVAGAGAIAVDQPLLDAALIASLPILLAWSIGLGVAADRTPPPAKTWANR